MRKLFIICHGNLLLMTRLWLFGEATDVIACLLAHCHVKKMLLRKSCLPRRMFSIAVLYVQCAPNKILFSAKCFR